MAENKECICIIFDLQAVLQTSAGDIAAFYYKSKLSVFNFTVYDVASKEAHCFVWSELDGNRGVNEIGSCILKYIVNKYDSENHKLPLIMFSDNCAGQQKNQFIAALLIFLTQRLKIPTISLNFLVVGHTQNENDHVHSLIEKQKKLALRSGPVYVPAQWVGIIKSSKKMHHFLKCTKCLSTILKTLNLYKVWLDQTFK